MSIRCQVRTITVRAVCAVCAVAGMTMQAHATPPEGTAPRGSAFRCTSAQGTVSYSQQPCAAGTNGQLLRAQDERSDAQRREAEAILARDKKLAQAADRQARRAQTRADTETAPDDGTQPGSLGAPVRQVAVGQREVDRRGAQGERLRHDPRHFRAKVPRKAAQAASSAG